MYTSLPMVFYVRCVRLCDAITAIPYVHDSYSELYKERERTGQQRSLWFLSA